MSVECINLPGRLVPHQVPGLHHDGVLLAPVVLDVERPVLLHVLAHVDDGRDDVCADLDGYPGFSLVDLLHYCALIGLEPHSDATPALLCHKEPAKGKKYPFGCLELILSGIRELA